ncbi:MAG: hypothetical protein ACYDEP_02410 [Acidimicrobiales bacterium]
MSARTTEHPRRRLLSVRPESMWLPLLWLPPQLDNRYTFQIINGDVVVHTQRSDARPGYPIYVENNELWTIRVALELGASGIYDDTSGTWVDMMQMISIDVDNPDDVARIADWLDGSDDDDLTLLDSGLEINAMLCEYDRPHWALDSALAMYDALLECTWTLGADSLLSIVDDLASDIEDGAMSDERYRLVLDMICLLGGTWLRDANVSNEPNENLWWATVTKRLAQANSRQTYDSLLSDLAQHLTIVREHYWPKMQEITRGYVESLTGAV